MPKINVLDKHVAELIAAGEVVERPSSVIKELIENSIDAGASSITVEIARGGITFMRVTDNGCGIDREDVAVAFLRHATSKVFNKDDLDSIATLGFRGEALASISAVSHVELITKTRGSGIGTRCVCDAGEVSSINDAGCPDGTTIIVRDLFYNTPARMKFLKKDVAEGNSAARIIDKIALSHPEISLRFIRDGSEVLHTPGDNKLRSAVYAVFGREFTNTLMPVNYELGGIKVYGLTSYPHASRPNRNMQNFFINGRCVRSKTAIAALEEAYKNSIMVGKFPACVIHMEMDFSQIDVNVHPAKLEIRFVNERPVFDAVYHAVKTALAANDRAKVMNLNSQPENHRNNNIFAPFAPNEKADQTSFSEQLPQREVNFSVQADMNNFHREAAENKPLVFDRQMPEDRKKPAAAAAQPQQNAKDSAYRTSLIEKIKREAEEDFSFLDSTSADERTPAIPAMNGKASADTEQKKNEHTFTKSESSQGRPLQTGFSQNEFPEEAPKKEKISRYIGEVFGTYIVLQYGDDKLMLIDKHAAHERILYEKLRKTDDGRDAQVLLVPVTVTLDKDDYTAVLENIDKFRKIGIDIDDFGDGTVIARTAPLMLDSTDIADAVAEMAAYLAQNRTSIETDYMDWLYANIACRAAIKEGNKNSDAELIEIARTLEENPEIRYCPHGRPIYMIIRKYDLEKQFGRIQ